MSTFSPEHLTIRNPETGIHNFSDAWSLTRAQLGATLLALEAVQPDISFNKSDLVGYHHIQYGMGPDIIEEAIRYAQQAVWTDWESTKVVHDVLLRVLGEHTTPARLERVILGPPSHVQEKLDLRPFEEPLVAVEVREETEARGGNIVSLYPSKGAEFYYNGRTQLDLGEVIINDRILPNMQVYSDSIQVRIPEQPLASRSLTLLSYQGSASVRPPIQSMRLL